MVKQDITDTEKTVSRSSKVVITRPKFESAIFYIKGNAPLVVHRFSVKTRNELKQKMLEGKSAGSKKNREPKDPEEIYNAGRYISSNGGWDGFNAAGLRKAMISACKLVDFKMTLAKCSIFVVQDGWDAKEPQIPLVRILDCESIMQEDIAKTSTGEPYVCFRPAYHGWGAKVHIRWDNDQFKLVDIGNLLVRVGIQVGLCEGRPDSKKGPGMGWGTFDVVESA
jgi:hypothetical protein